MKVVFWNTARGSSLSSESFERLIENCIAIAHGKPELIVLCEALKGTRKNLALKGGIPGYAAVKPFKTIAKYGDANTLRYVILARQDAKCVAYYCDTGTDRPAVHITINNYPLLAIHAPSVTQSVKPQSKAIGSAIVSPLSEPAVVFGDFNVDAFNSGMRNSFVEKVSDHFQSMFKGKGKLVAKYDSVCTRPKSGKALDWALANPSFQSAVKVKILKSTAPKKSKKKYEDDEDFEPTVDSTAKSDHEAIVIEIT